MYKALTDSQASLAMGALAIAIDPTNAADANHRVIYAATGEQAGAGLDQLTPEEADLFQKQNAAYREKFGFPFVICARLNKKEAILKGFEARLPHSRETERQTALAEIFKIAELRLADLLSD